MMTKSFQIIKFLYHKSVVVAVVVAAVVLNKQLCYQKKITAILLLRYMEVKTSKVPVKPVAYIGLIML
jgi:hypothetical protein